MAEGSKGVPLKDLTDEELVAAAKNDGDAFSALIERYLGSIRQLARVYTRIDADRDDLVSEGILGLMSAVKSYEEGRGASFATYAGVCVSNRMLSVLKKSARIQRVEEPLEEGSLESGTSPEKTVLDREFLSEIFSESAQSFTDLERAVFSEYLSGASYGNIAKKLGVPRKTVDNALARVRKKLRLRFR